MRPATSSIIVAAKKTRSRLASSDEVERQKADEAPITKSPEQVERKRGKRQQNQKYLAPRMKRGEVKATKCSRGAKGWHVECSHSLWAR